MSRFYDYSTASNVGNGFYPANSLYVSSVSDENGNVTEEFKDQEGKVVLKRVYNNTQGLPKLFSAASNTPASSPMPSVGNILGDELKGKSVQDFSEFEIQYNDLKTNLFNDVEGFNTMKSNNVMIVIKHKDILLYKALY